MDKPNVVMVLSDDGDVTMTHCHDEGVPGLDPVSESEDSSYGSFSDRSRDVQSMKRPLHSKKRVSWDCIHTREFALVVGDHPFCQDGLPVSLDWQHADDTKPILRIACQQSLSERKHSYVFPRRLSYEERKQRLRNVSGLTEDQLKNDEIDLVVRTLQESWACAMEGTSSPPFDPTPIAEDDVVMMGVWDDVICQDIDIDLGDVTDFEWTD